MAKNIVNLTIDGGSYTARPYGTCSTAAGTAAKAVTCADFELVSGTTIIVKFDAANTASTPTLNVNSKGAKNIFHKGAQITSGGNKALLAGTVEFLYDGTQWQLLGNYIDTDSNTDTKNTAGSTDTSSLIYLIGATSQAANPQTYSHNTVYVGTDGCLYSNSTKVSVEGHTQSYTTLTGSSTTANQAIVSSGTANGWTLKTLGSNAFNSTTIPTNTNQLTNGAGFITSSGSITGSSGSCTGNAATATALTTKSEGNSTQPVYFDANGKPVKCTAYSSASVNYANSAGAVAWGNVSGKPSSYTPSSHNHTKLVGSTVGGNNSFFSTASSANGALDYYYNINMGCTGMYPASNNANSVLLINKHGGTYDSQLGFSSDGNIYYRSFNGAAANTTTPWDKIPLIKGANTITSLNWIPLDKHLVIANLSAASNIYLDEVGLQVGESVTIIGIPSASFTQPIPTVGNWISMDGDSLEVTKDKPFEMNILCYASGKYSISCKNSK